MKRSAALTDLGDMCPVDSYPALSTDQVNRALNKSALIDANGYNPDTYGEWAAGITISVGDKYTPTERNGYYYEASVAGTTDATEPGWSTTIEDTVVDGSVTWTVKGYAKWAGRWDLNNAAALLWDMKANKVANLTNVQADGQTFNQGDLKGYFAERAAFYRKKKGIRSIPYNTATANRNG